MVFRRLKHALRSERPAFLAIAQNSTYSIKVPTCSRIQEKLDTFHKNGWILWTGIGGDFELESLGSFNWSGHLAFMLEMSLMKKLEEKGKRVKLRELLIDLEEVRAVEIEVEGKRYVVRTELQGEASSAFSAVGLRPPSRVMEMPR